MMTFGQRLRALRRRRLLTQAELAAILGVDQRKISLWENDGAVPRAARQRRLCDALGVTPDTLLEGEPSSVNHEHQDGASRSRDPRLKPVGLVGSTGDGCPDEPRLDQP